MLLLDMCKSRLVMLHLGAPYREERGREAKDIKYWSSSLLMKHLHKQFMCNKNGPPFHGTLSLLSTVFKRINVGGAYQLSLRIGNGEFLIDCLWI